MKAKKFISFILSAMLLGSAVSVNALEIHTYSDEVHVYYNGQDVYANSEYKPIIINDRTMVQIKPIFAMMGYMATYNPESKEATFLFNDSDTGYRFKADDIEVTEMIPVVPYEGEKYELDVPATIYNDTFYVPLRSFCEIIAHLEIHWNGDARRVDIYNSDTTDYLSQDIRGEWYTEEENQSNPSAGSENTQGLETENSVLGLYKHPQYPDNYGVAITAYDGNNISFEVYAISGNAARVTNIKGTKSITNGVCEFGFTDSFGNTGTGTLTLDGNNVSVEFNVPQYVGQWCVDEAAGTYAKSSPLPEGFEGVLVGGTGTIY